MYGRNPNLLARRLDHLANRGDHVCVKTHFARRVGSLTGELDVMSRLQLPLRG